MFPYDTTRYYQMRVENDGPRIRAYIDGKLVLEAQDNEIQAGKAGVIASHPHDFRTSPLPLPIP